MGLRQMLSLAERGGRGVPLTLGIRETELTLIALDLGDRSLFEEALVEACSFFQ